MDIDALLAELTVDEKASLTAGADFWSTVPIDRVGIPRVKVTDGPHGARGEGLPGAPTTRSLNTPCGAALGATWDPALVERVGALLGRQAQTKGAQVLLAPNVNLVRGPLAGRNFEVYSEDPLLSGRCAVGFVRGVQSTGVAATVKHLVANESEFERATLSSDVDERTLRELYFVPFELAVKQGRALAVMTAYNRLNGDWCANSRWLLEEVLRGEWRFDGIVMTDWLAAVDTVAAARAGLDLEMPGPGRRFGPAYADAVHKEHVTAPTLDATARRLLSFIDRVVDAAPSRDAARAAEDPDDRDLLREVSAAAMVLVRNDGILPLRPAPGSRLAVIGPLAAAPRLNGGGSAAVAPIRRITPLETLGQALGDCIINYRPGCDIDRAAPPLNRVWWRTPDGEPGIEIEYFEGEDLSGAAVARRVLDDADFLSFGPPEGVPDSFSFRARAQSTAFLSGVHRITLVQAGGTRVLVNGELVLDGVTHPPPRDHAMWGAASSEAETEIELHAGDEIDVTIEYTPTKTRMVRGARVGWRLPSASGAIDDAVALAASSDAAIVFVGHSAEHEAEGFDRPSMRLVGEQDELVRRVVAANPRTVVVATVGAPIEMDWLDGTAATLITWFGGEGMAEAIAAVLTGACEPGGRMPTTFPLRLEHSPSHGNYPGENGRVRYGEGLLVGYRWYDTRHLPVRIPFGHGLSYASFTLGPPHLGTVEYIGGELVVDVPVTNSSNRAGSEVVQCYVAPPTNARFRPARELKAFAKVTMAAGESGSARLVLDERSFAHWDPAEPDRAELDERAGAGAVLIPPTRATAARTIPGWYIDPGDYELHIGRSIVSIDHVATIHVPDGIGPLPR